MPPSFRVRPGVPANEPDRQGDASRRESLPVASEPTLLSRIRQSYLQRWGKCINLRTGWYIDAAGFALRGILWRLQQR
jgi:hypothetical protein